MAPRPPRPRRRFRQAGVNMTGYFRTDTQLGLKTRLILYSLIFILCAVLWVWFSHSRNAENPDDKLTPTPAKLMDAFRRVALQEYKGEYRLWVDTRASARRVGIALAIILLAIFVGLHMGSFPAIGALLSPFMIALNIVPAVILLPAMMAIPFLGVGEATKITLMCLGVFPKVAIDAFLRAKQVRRELIEKAQSLGATELEVAYRVILPQILPYVVDSIRLNMGLLVTLLIASESVAASAGLGYRVYLVGRQCAMDIVIVYTMWVSLICFVIDMGLQALIKLPRRFSWVDK